MSEPNNNPINTLKQQVTEYVDLKMQLIKLEFYEKASVLSATLASGLVVILLVLFFVVSLFLSIALYIGQLLHNYALGFAISSIAYLVLLFIFYALAKKSFKKYVTNKLIKLFFNDEE